jgi:5-methylcytosine-specific restriction endonuclease McrA
VPRSIKEWFPKHEDGTPNHDAKIPNSVRDRIIERSDGRCVVCQRAFGLRLAPEMDHRPPLSAGGEHRESCIFATCAECHLVLSKEDSHKRAEVRKGNRKKWGVKKKSKYPVRGWRKMDGTIVWAKDRKKK